MCSKWINTVCVEEKKISVFHFLLSNHTSIQSGICLCFAQVQKWKTLILQFQLCICCMVIVLFSILIHHHHHHHPSFSSSPSTVSLSFMWRVDDDKRPNLQTFQAHSDTQWAITKAMNLKLEHFNLHSKVKCGYAFILSFFFSLFNSTLCLWVRQFEWRWCERFNGCNFFFRRKLT